MRLPNNYVGGGTPVLPQDKLSNSSQISFDYREDISIHSLSSTWTQSGSAPRDVYIAMRMPPASTSLDIILPSSGKSRGSNQSPDYDEEQIIPGLHYPPSWQQSFASQGASRKLCDSSDDDSFHSVTSCNEESLAGILLVGANTNQCFLKEHLIRYQKVLMIVSTLLSLIMALMIIMYYPPLTLPRLRLW